MSGASRLDRAAAGVLAATAAALVGLGIEGRQLRWVLWTDRDLWRALVTPLATTGPELSFGSGGRIPGGGVQLLLAPFVALDGDPVFVWRALAVAIGLGVAALGWRVGRSVGALAAGVTVAGLMTTEVVADALWTLWNPAMWAPCAMVAWAAFLRLVHDRDGRALPLWAGALALGVQLHASAALLALAMGLALAVARPAVRPVHVGLALLVVLGLYAPHLVDEATHGWPNTRLLLAQGAQLPPRPPGLVGRNVLAAGRALAGVAPRTTVPTFVEASGAGDVVVGLRWALVAAGLALARSRSSDPARGRTTLATAFVVAAVGAAVVTSSFQLDAGTTRRFLVGVLPGVALLGGLGAVALVDVAGRARALVPVLVTALLVVQGGATVQRWQQASGSWSTWRHFRDLLGVVTATTGWTLAEASGRTVLVAGGEGGWGTDWFPVDGVSYLLAREGQGFPGASRGPCAVAFPFVPPDAPPLDADVLGRLLRVEPTAIRLHEVERTADGHVVATYDLGPARCPSSLVDRYVPTPAEDATRPLLGALAAGEVREVDAPDGGRRFVVHAGSAYGDGGERPLLWAVDLTPGTGTIDVTLHANQLRGHSYNGGFLSNALVRSPTLVLDGPGGHTELVIAPGDVGHVAAPTPIAGTWVTSPPLLAGTYTATLRWEDLATPERRFHPTPEAPTARQREAILARDLTLAAPPSTPAPPPQ